MDPMDSYMNLFFDLSFDLFAGRCSKFLCGGFRFCEDQEFFDPSSWDLDNPCEQRFVASLSLGRWTFLLNVEMTFRLENNKHEIFGPLKGTLILGGHGVMFIRQKCQAMKQKGYCILPTLTSPIRSGNL